MALPFLLPALFTIGSIGANMIGANKAASAVASANALERERQDRFDDQAFAINNKARERYDNIDQKMGDETNDLAQLFKDAAATPTPHEAALPKTNSNLVINADAKAATETREKSGERAESLAGLRSLGSLLSTFGLQGQRDAGELNMIRGFKRGSASVLPAELSAAQMKGAGLRTLGDLLSLGAAFTTPAALTASAAGGSVPWLSKVAPAAKGAVVPTSAYTGPLLPSLY